MIKKASTMVVIGLLAAGLTYAQHAHVHGVARVDLALEDARHAVVELSAPAEDVLGFEPAPRDEPERQREQEGLERWRVRVGEMLVFETRLGCTIDAGTAEVTAAGEDGHREVRVGAEVRCREPLTGSQLRLELRRFYPTLHEIELTIVSSDRQSRHRLRKAEAVVEL